MFKVDFVWNFKLPSYIKKYFLNDTHFLIKECAISFYKKKEIIKTPRLFQFTCRFQ